MRCLDGADVRLNSTPTLYFCYLFSYKRWDILAFRYLFLQASHFSFTLMLKHIEYLILFSRLLLELKKNKKYVQHHFCEYQMCMATWVSDTVPGNHCRWVSLRYSTRSPTANWGRTTKASSRLRGGPWENETEIQDQNRKISKIVLFNSTN